MAIKNPALIVTVDTEEDDAWTADFRADGNTVDNIRGVQRFQELCDRFDVKPTYLVDTPVIEDDASVALLRRLQDNSQCEIGAHLHPWCAPPFDAAADRRSSYMCNLSESVQRAKLERLTDTITQRFGRRPTSFRAGRYGLDMRGATILEQLEYVVDSSVISFMDYSHDGGPDFRRAPTTPYWLGGGDLCTPVQHGSLLEVPVSVGFSRSNFRLAHRLQEVARRRVLRPFRLVGILDRLGIARQIKFSPEREDGHALKRLVDCFVSNNAPCMVMMLHSSSLVPGGSPYVKDPSQLERLLQAFEDCLEHCLRHHNMKSQTLTAFANTFAQQRSKSSPRPTNENLIGASDQRN